MDDATGQETAIQVVNLTKQYRQGPLANDGITLSVARGELFGLLGPNGAGKSTLVRQVTGELMPSSGEVRVFGIDVIKRPVAARRLLGVVPQEAGLFGVLTVEDHLTSFGRIRGLRGRTLRTRVEQLVQELNLGEHRGKRAMRLSGGLKRKLLVGIALLGSPRAIVLDEPTTGLDPQSRREVWDMIRGYQRGGAAVLLTTHYMEEAEYLSDRVGIMSQGRLAAMGTVEELHSRISNRYKLTYRLPDGDYPRERITTYGRTADELNARIAELGLEEYDLARTNLEDIYLELTKRPFAEEESDTLVP